MGKPSKHYGKWRIRWVDQKGDRLSASFDDYKIAAHELRQHEIEVEEIRRGLRSPRPPDKHFREVAAYWIANRVPQKRSGSHDESIIRHHLLPFFGDLLVREIGIAEVDRFVASLTTLDKKTIANILTLLISMLNLAVDLVWLVKVPRIKKPKVRLFEKDFRYLRTDEETARFLRAAKEEGPLCFAMYSTAVYTGLRAGELAALQWEDISFERRLITVQRSFDGPTKSGDVRHVPILDPLLPLLREWKLLIGGTLVFPNRDGNMYQQSGRIFQEVFKRVLKAAGFPEVVRRGKLRPSLVFHDLRHSFSSAWVMHGGDLFRLQRILGHKSAAMTQRYAHLAPSAFSGDYSRLGSQPISTGATIVEVRMAPVVPFVRSVSADLVAAQDASTRAGDSSAETADNGTPEDGNNPKEAKWEAGCSSSAK